jgi:hypothetical protein
LDTQKIRFVANRPWLTAQSPSRPEPILNTIPDWYRKADSFAMNPTTGKPWEMENGGGKYPTWKACPAVFDVMGSGYTYNTPCDIEFSEDAQGKIQAKALDERYQNFLFERVPLDSFAVPAGYHAKHFAWWPDWSVELPDGYSALYTHPLNRFEQPFLTVSGIVDNDQVKMPGTMPFFVLKGTVGLLPAGTPYAQILPFKREHWESETDISITAEEIEIKNKNNVDKYRRPDGAIYIKEVWERRKYE